MEENSGVVGGGELAVVRGAQRYHNVSSGPHFVDFDPRRDGGEHPF